MVLEREEVSDGILRLSLNRPKKLNALSKELLREVADALRAADGDYMVVVVEGAGDAFTAGADLDEAQDEGEDVELFQDVTRAAREFGGVVIGKLHGWVVGGGFEWTLSFDLRYAATDTTFKMTESEIGLPVSNASTVLLPLTIGAGKARELVFTAREFDAAEAEELGLVAGVYDADELDDRVREVAEDIVENKSPPALRANKRGFNAGFPVEGTLDYEVLLAEVCAADSGGEIRW